MGKRASYISGLYCPKCNSDRMFRTRFVSVASGRPRYECSDCKHRTVDPLRSPKQEPSVFSTRLKKSRIYVVTSAQNATPVNEKFLASLLHYCEHRNAQLVVIPLRYKNPTSEFSEEQEDVWAPELAKYLFAGRAHLNNNITILGDIKTQPTAEQPLSGFETISGPRSAIIGHPKIALQAIPAPQHKLPKLMISTGSVTRSNYTDSKAGKKGEFHHSYGAAVIEIADNDLFFPRQINAVADGSFIDLEWHATPDGVKPAPNALGLAMGDTHVRFLDPQVDHATFTAPGSIVSKLKPAELVWHDIHDNHSVNHHHRHNPFIELAKVKSGKRDVLDEVAQTAWHLRKRTPEGVRSIVVASNHNDGLGRWIRETDWRDDLPNAEFYLETALHMAQNTEMGKSGGKTPDPLHYWLGKLIPKKDMKRIVLLGRNTPYSIAGISIDAHGDKGPNGAKGSIQGYRRVGAKSIIGHTHSPGIMDGCYQVGTSSYLQLDYNEGPSSWLHAHCVIYANGKRSLLMIVNGRWRL